ncbi:hypothetical protein C4588_05895 [Candidatus Parcubacteria bacterium]|nr:MAG: hypothetical protein C4588_05895 [Candidatus Parcubacteria bacterium]
MIVNLLKCLEETIYKTSIRDLNFFLKSWEKKGVTKWIICSDYCLNDCKKLYNAFTFTLIPYIINFDELKEIIKEFAPKDLKEIKSIHSNFHKFIKNGFCFNFTFIIHKDKEHIMYNVEKDIYIDSFNGLIKDLKLWIKNTPTQKDYYKEIIKKINICKKDLTRTNFNKTLYSNIMFTNFLAAYISYLITKKCKVKPEIIGWFSDRDNMTTYKNLGLIFDLYYLNFHNLCAKYKVDNSYIKIAFGDCNPGEKFMWYDEMLRFSDYLSGALAGRNYISATPDKYDELFEQSIANNKFISIIYINKENNGVSAARVKVTLKK